MAVDFDSIGAELAAQDQQQAQPAAAAPGAVPAASPQPSATPVAPQPSASPGAPQPPTAAAPAYPAPADGSDIFANSASLADTGEALGVGLAKGVFATKDFFATGAGLWGETPKEADRSNLRQWVDSTDAAQSAKWGIGYDMTSGLAQGAVGLLGVGKLQALGTAANLAITTVRTTAAFEAHSANIANLVAKVPSLDGPVTQFFASSPDDSTAKGYMKNALTSLGIEGVAAGLFTGTAAVLKAWHSGDQAAIDASHVELEKALGEHVQGLQQQAPGGEPSTTTSTPSATGAPPSSSATSSSPGSPLEPSASSTTLGSTPGGGGVTGLPPTPQGSVRLFHGGEEPTAGGGRWVTQDPSYAANFRAGTPNSLHYVDVPEDHPALQGAKAWDQVDEQSGTNMVGRYNHFEAPEDIAQGLKPVPEGGVTGKVSFNAPDIQGVEPPRVLPPANENLTGARPPTAEELDRAHDVNAGVDVAPQHAPTDDDVSRVISDIQAKNAARAGGSDVRAVSSPTQGAEAIGVGKLPPKPTLATIDDDALSRIVESAANDQAMLIKHGSWDAAVEAGHTFGSEDKIPWQMIGGEAGASTPETALDAFTARVRDTLSDQYDAMKGGAVISDDANAKAVSQLADLWNLDPAAMLGVLQRAGKAAPQARATMEAGFLVSGRAMQDAWTMASRIKMGELSEWGGDINAAYAALKMQTQLGATASGNALSLLSNAARAMRGARSEFRLDPAAVRNLQSVDGNDLVELLASTRGNPKALGKAVSPTMWQMIKTEGPQLFLVNNLISNPITHAIIFGSNAWQTIARPAQRAIGATFNGTLGTVGKEAMKQYYYMASSIPDALNEAYKAWKMGDSVIAPHDVASGGSVGGGPTATALGPALAQAQFGPWNNTGDILRNALLAMGKTLSTPTRFVGMQDELVKQIGYRGKVQAQAVVEGTQQGLAGNALKQFVEDKLYNSFDAAGRATDGAALNEAKIATYQNDLQDTGRFGWTPAGTFLQNSMGQNFPPARIVLPFVRTPVNLFRQGVQLTPGLNLIQQEYSQAIKGAMGPEKQAQAIGQMAMGSLIMGSTGLLAYQGYVTGDEPSNKKLAAEAMATGWRPNSIVHANKDGSKTYIPFARYDPIMMPFAMAANIVSVLTSDQPADQNKAESMLGAMSVMMMKQLTDKLYLQNFKQTLDAFSDPDKSWAKWAGGMAGNYVPMSSALHLVNPDPVMREADTFIGAALGKVPGYSPTLPARRDWAGDPVSVHKGLWLNSPGDAADAEIQRLALTQGAAIGSPSSRARGEADFRNITLAGNVDKAAAGQNAYDRFQELAGHPERMPGGNKDALPLKTAVENLVGDRRYQNMPDGAPDTPGTKIATLTALINGYRNGAKRFMGADTNVRQAEYSEAMRVAAAAGHLTPASPTPTNAADGLIKRLGSFMGVGGMGAPPPATPTLALPGGGTGQ